MARTLFAIPLFALLLLLFSESGSASENWPRFRGPYGNGHSNATTVPLKWSETENIVWKTKTHGKAWSSPVIWDDEVWLSTATEDGKKMALLCVDRQSGKIKHDIIVFHNDDPDFCHDFNSYASCTPVMEEGVIYPHFGKYGTACIDTATGEKIWERRDFDCDHHRGPGSSPIIYKNLLIVAYDGVDVQYIAAIDKRNGKTVWKTDRGILKHVSNPDMRKGYGTPSIVDVNGQPQLVTSGGYATLGLNPDDGTVIWRVVHGGMNSSATPLFTDDTTIVSAGTGGLRAVRLGREGNLEGDDIRWSLKKGASLRSSPLLLDGHLYMATDKGAATCVDAKTGEVIWQGRLGSNFSASPIFAVGRIYFCDQDGITTVIAPGKEFKILARNRLDDGCMASPAVSGKSLFVRTISHLYRIEH